MESSKTVRVYLVTSGCGHEVDLGMVQDLPAATLLVQRLDQRFEAWEIAGFPKLPKSDPLRAYEGCDVYADVGDITYTYHEDAWELFTPTHNGRYWE